MSCCGKKRAELVTARRTIAMPPAATVDSPLPRRGDGSRIFEFTGSGVLTVTGAGSGRVYEFGPMNPQLEVAFEDSFAMMAEPNLRRIARRS